MSGYFKIITIQNDNSASSCDNCIGVFSETDDMTIVSLTSKNRNCRCRLYAHDEYYRCKLQEINEEEYNFLKELMYDSYKDRSDEADEFKKEFYDGVAGTTEYSFLVFEGLDLYYIDEDGTRHEAYVDEEQNTII